MGANAVAATVERQTMTPARRPKRVKPETSIIFATVTRVERTLPRVQRITLHSPEFAGFLTDVPDQFITFLFPKEDRKIPVVERSFEWEDFMKLDAAARPHARNYTVRQYRPHLQEIDVDMILHGDEATGSAWALHAEPGDALAIWGPRTAYDPPPNMTWQLLVADETGLPAIAAILDHLAPTITTRVIAEIASRDDEYPLSSPAPFEVTWLYREDTQPGDDDRLLQAVRSLPFPEGVRYAWGGGEYQVMNAIGRYLRRECGFRPSDVAAIGYW